MNEKWGVINSKFELVVDYLYDYIQECNDGLMVVAKGNETGMIDTKGEIIIDFGQYEIWSPFIEGLAPVYRFPDDGSDEYASSSSISPPIECGYINTKGELVIPYQFDGAENFKDGVAAVASNDGWGYINKKGDYVIQPKLAYLPYYQDGLISVEDFTTKSEYYIDLAQNEIIPHDE